jgi:hypothetical protein
MDKTTREMRYSHWKTIIEQCQDRPKGISAKQWLSDSSINEKSYYYWLRQLRKEAYEQVKSTKDLPLTQVTGQVAFAEIPISPQNIFEGSSYINHPAAVIKTSTATIALSNEISERLLSMILREVAHA